MRVAVIMAGGSGTRLWPSSRRARPKQFMELLGRRSLLQATLARLTPLIPPERTLVVTHRRWRAEVRRQLPELPRRNIVAEPAARGTAPCVALAALALRRRHAEASLVVLPADHLIGAAVKFRRVLRDGFRFVEAHPEYALTLGIRPSRPSTAYGYLQRGERLATLPSGGVERVARFIEKPPAQRARELLAGGGCLWNAGIFVWKLRTFEALVERHMPELARQLPRLASLLGQPRRAAELAELYAGLPAQSIDYGIMEKAEHVAVLPCDLPWNDVGSWSSLRDIMPRDAKGNVVRRPGRAALVDVHDSIIWSDELRVAAIGIHDIIVVEHEGMLLLCPVSRDQEIKALLDRLKAEGKEGWL
ncbi:MAG: mannose-1-phosphate guanylyltransferase [Candidatus Tectomicrobia bacterium]|nr:mannose-1-phosphate guanylyltransferase [Candidatus Tectomicrobia bacterium]